MIISLVEHRRRIKTERDQHERNSSERKKLDIVQNQLKILANATSYGILIEINTEDIKSTMDVYGLDHTKSKVSKRENSGRFYHPIIATMLTSGARLLLAMAEAWLERNKGYYAFCDTDGIAVSPRHWKQLQSFFEPLNPFSFEDSFLKLENENYDVDGKRRELWFYGISAKRYVLLIKDENGNPTPIKWSTHGLGHISNCDKDWEKKLWLNILHYEMGLITQEELLAKYQGKHVVSQLTITSAHVLNRVKKLNEGEDYQRKIKPFNFLLVGSPTITNDNGEMIHPLTIYMKNYDEAPYKPFIDYKTGKLFSENTNLYWKTLDQAMIQYKNHPENKFKNGHKIGKMKRRHLITIEITHIGKETNELEESEILGVTKNSFVKYG